MFLLLQKSFNFLGVEEVEVPSHEGCPLTQTFYTKKIDIYIYEPLAARAGVVPSGLGELTPAESGPP